MPGWIIQGVRGEGKSLCAVGKIKEYLSRGCVVATNLDLYLENLLPDDSLAQCYRLPDHPRIEHFEMLPDAYDPKYKGEDKNGLLVLDELGTWLNSRQWNDKGRLEILKWLFLSRKRHWDLILLAQDHEMIDSQVKTALCDYLVIASRTDRQKLPFIGSAVEFLGLSANLPKWHVYSVFYGFSTQVPPVDRWKFRGHEFYDGYDTNQLFKDGHEIVGDNLRDMRTVYQYLPPAYLTNQIHISKHEQAIEILKRAVKNPVQQQKEALKMAIQKGVGGNSTTKAYFLIIGAALFLAWRFLGSGVSVPAHNDQSTPTASNTPPLSHVPLATPPAAAPVQNPILPSVITPQANQIDQDHKKVIETDQFINTMLSRYKPRLSSHAYSEDIGFKGFIEWYDGSQLVERLSITDLHAFGVALVRTTYGADLIVGAKRYAITSWPKLTAPPINQNPQPHENT